MATVSVLTGVVEFVLLGQGLPLPHDKLCAVVREQQTPAVDASRRVHGGFSTGRARPRRHAVEALAELSDAGTAGRGKRAFGHSGGGGGGDY